MADAVDFLPGGFRFVPSVFQYSAGVAALPGCAIERVRFRAPVPLDRGFAEIERIIRGAGRPLTAFCACELRSPAQFTEDGFRAFNQRYVATLEKWGLFDGKINPVARSNVCPQIAPPGEPSFHAFSFTVVASITTASFVIAGSAEAREGGASYNERIVRRGETTPEAMREKARHVLAEMERRLSAFGLAWSDTTATQVYTVQDFHPFLADEIVRRGAAHAGLTWHYARPPVQGLEYEMDCRGVANDRVI
ncbi:MAG TPA: hypothetical protein VH934_05965 [Xanthobacteraceae bacterium]|jgi:hypothetical protein